jgi:hypothetical protein
MTPSGRQTSGSAASLIQGLVAIGGCEQSYGGIGEKTVRPYAEGLLYSRGYLSQVPITAMQSLARGANSKADS